MRAYYRTIDRLRAGMIVLNYAIIMLYASVCLIGTKYLIDRQTSLSFLTQLSHIPKNPLLVFIGCFGLYALFVLHVVKNTVLTPFLFRDLVMEWILAYRIVLLLNMATQSIVLLVIVDMIFPRRPLKNKEIYEIIVFSILLYIGSNYALMQRFFPMSDLRSYFTIFSSWTSSILLLFRSLLEGINLLLFIIIIAYFLINQYEEKESIAQELDMVNQVNAKLRNYAALSEKIAQDNERKRIAREIHDTLGHALTGIAAGLDACLVMIEKKPELVKTQLQKIRNVVTEGIQDVRGSLEKLRPGALEEHGLQGALQKMINEFMAVSNVEINLSWQMPRIDFEKTKEDVLFRMIQECITNAIRHGHASMINIWIQMDQNDPCQMQVIVHDNGKGSASIQPGYGLMQMKERISTIHGTLYYDGSDGFVCKALIPLQKGEFDD